MLKNGVAETEEMTKGEMDAVREKAQAVLKAMSSADDAEFEAKMKELNEYAAGEDQYTDGYYLNLDTDYASLSNDYAYLSQIAEKLKDAADGTTVLVESTEGVHIVRKYKPTSGAYDLAVNKPWFTTFSSSLTESLLLEKCRALFDSVRLDEDVLASATDIRRIGTNLYLY